ncbi:class I SAM-dependent DNA methyltransferase [Methylobacterium sp. A54F]
MNAVEIEEAVSELADAPFDPNEFPFAFLQAFGNKETTVRRLRARSGNASDVPGGVLQRSNIHLAICDEGAVGETLRLLRESPKTAANKAKFVLATDGATVEAEELATGEVVACDFGRLGDHFGFFLPLAGISTVRQIKNNPIDVKATGRLNRLYVELLKDNPDWGTPERRHDLNHFMARLIFCFFAEDTGIFLKESQFSETIRRMSDAGAGNTHEVIAELFRAMDTPTEYEGRPDERFRKAAGIKTWADKFPYVNGNLFAGAAECPFFSRIARSYLLRAAELSWRDINPDIFGSMIQAVADDAERGALGMHYTSVPNILKVLNPLFLDSLRAALETAGDSVRKLRALRRRLAAIRVFDPACGSGNFLVIAYKELRAIEATIIARTGDEARTVIPLSNFFGIEVKDFAAEVARLALLIAEFQCDVRFIDQATARSLVLPLKQTGQIVRSNALRTNWLEVCPPIVNLNAPRTDLLDFVRSEDGLADGSVRYETFICGNPPYTGSKWQNEDQKLDLEAAFCGRSESWKSLDYVSGWFIKAADYSLHTEATVAFVSTNSLCQGQQVPALWPLLFQAGVDIAFAHTSFIWSNLASRQAAVTVVIVGLKRNPGKSRLLFENTESGQTSVREVDFINAYLIAADNVIVAPARKPLTELPEMLFGNMPRDAGHLLLTDEERRDLLRSEPEAGTFIKLFQGSEDFTNGQFRGCIWIEDSDAQNAVRLKSLQQRIASVADARSQSSAASTRQFAGKPYRFVQIQGVAKSHSIIVPRHTSESREYLPVGLNSADVIIADSALAIYDSEIWALAIIASRIHLVWIAAVCGKIKSDYRYANTLGWNTFPLPRLTEANKVELSSCADGILIARERHFPRTVSELYEPSQMPVDLRAAHDKNDETLERIYIGRRFRNDTERLEKLFQLYAAMVSADPNARVRPETSKRARSKQASFENASGGGLV